MHRYNIAGKKKISFKLGRYIITRRKKASAQLDWNSIRFKDEHNIIRLLKYIIIEEKMDTRIFVIW